jgi:hypothetical protein
MRWARDKTTNRTGAALEGGQLRAKIVGRAWRIKRPDLDADVKKL